MKNLFLFLVLVIFGNTTQATEGLPPTYQDRQQSQSETRGYYQGARSGDYNSNYYGRSSERYYAMSDVDTLEYYRSEALRAYSRSNYSEALNAFKSGLNALNLGNSSNSAKWVQRTSIMLEQVEASLELSQKSVRLLCLFLEKSYEFLIKYSLKFDRQYYNSQYGYQISSVDNIEREYVKTVFSYLSKMVDSFVMSDRRGRVYPFGSLQLTKSVFELISVYASYDLDDSFMAEYYSCERSSLLSVSSFLGSMRTSDVNVYIMTNTYQNLSDVISGYRCN